MSMGAASHSTFVAIAIGDIRYMASIAGTVAGRSTPYMCIVGSTVAIVSKSWTWGARSSCKRHRALVKVQGPEYCLLLCSSATSQSTVDPVPPEEDDGARNHPSEHYSSSMTLQCSGVQQPG